MNRKTKLKKARSAPSRSSATPLISSTTIKPRSRPAKSSRQNNIPRPNDPFLWLIPCILIGIIGVAIFALLILSTTSSPSSKSGSAAQDIEGTIAYANLTQEHVPGRVNYPQIPPVGGSHAPAWQNCGIYDQPVANETSVHSLEHGAVWLTYQPNLPVESIEQLKTLARGRGYVLMTPYPGLDKPIAATAWGYQLKVDKADDPRLSQFLTKYIQSSQAPEPGASCFGAIGTPKER